MATESLEQESGSNPFERILKSGIALSPIALAGYDTFRKVHANSAINPVQAAVSSSSPGRLGQLGRGIGKKLRKSVHKTKQELLSHAQDEIDKLTSEDGMQKLFQSVSEQRAVIQSLLDTMDDPSAGLPDEFVLSYREKLVDIAQNSLDGPQAREVVSSVIKAMNDGNTLTQDAKGRWVSNLREYRNVAPYLTPPSSSIEAGQVFQPIHISDISPSSVAYTRYKHLIGNLGDNGSQFVKLAQFGSGANKQIYARVYSAGGASPQGSFLGALPLDLGQSSAGYTNLRMNENLTTGYRANRFVIDAQAAQNVFNMSGGKPVTYQELQAKAFVSLEDYQINKFLEAADINQQNLYIRGGRNNFNAWRRQLLAADTRLTSSGQPFSNATGMVQHIQGAASFQHNFATVANFGRMNKQAQRQLIQNLASVTGFESGIGADRIISRGINNEVFGTIGLYQGSALSALRSTSLDVLRGRGSNYLEERGLFPTTSRLEQITGRESAFIRKSVGGYLTKNKVFTAGATSYVSRSGDLTMTGRNVEWAKTVTGGTNKAMILDVSETGKLYQALEGTGAAYHLGRERVREAFTKPVLEPKSHGILGSKFLEDLMERVQDGELVRYTPEQIRSYGGFLGLGPSGNQFIRQDPRMIGARIGYRVTEVGGKKHINIIGEIDRMLETFKGFSLMHKGTLQEISSGAQAGLVGQETLNVLNSLGIGEEHRVFTSGDMLKKGAGFFDLQMTSAYGMVTGDKNFRKTLAQLANKQQFAGLGNSHIGRVTGAVIKGLGKHVGQGVTPQQAGMVLGAIYTRGEDWLGGLNTSQAVSQSAIRQAVEQQFGVGTKITQGILETASRGVALAATTYSHGTGVGDYALGRGSVEPRFFSNLQHRLRRMGISASDTSDFLAKIYKNKIAYGAHLQSATGMLKLAESVTGVRGASDAANMLANGVPTYGLTDLSTIVPDIKSGNFGRFMSEHSQGFVLDLNQGVNTPAQRALAASANDVFRQGQIFIPGSEVLNAMRGTVIKTKDKSIAIEDEYSRMVTNFLEDLSTLSTNTSMARKSAAESMVSFKENVMSMASKVVHQVASGKIRGLQAQVAAIYDLTKGTGFKSTHHAQLATDIFKKTRGMSVFLDTKGFLTQLKDFMGGDLSVSDAAKKAERFFTAFEGGTTAEQLVHRAKGIVGISSRHPLLSLGNVAPVQIFRHLEETGMGRADEAFSRFIKTELGQEYEQLKGFHDVARMERGARKNFFKKFVRSLSDYQDVGGGRLFLPRRMEQIHYLSGGEERTLKVDMGVAGAAIGDWDGDQFQLLMVNEDAGKHIMSTLKSSQTRQQWLTADNVYKIKSEIFAEEAKAGLKQHLIGMDNKIGFADVQRIQQDLMKESASKDLVGSLDVRMNKIRAAILDMSLENPGLATQAEEALALLKVTQEHANIKGKKLPIYKAFSEMLGSSIDDMFAGAGVGSFKRVMREEIFPGSSLVSDTGLVFGQQDSNAMLKDTRAAVNSLSGGVMRLDTSFDIIEQAVNRARITGVSDYLSQGQMAKALTGAPTEVERLFAIVHGSQTLQGGLLSEFGADPFKQVGAVASNVVTNIRSAAQRLDRKTQGLLALGAMSAVGIGGLVSNPGYSATPLEGDMEMIPNRTRDAMVTGNLLQERTANMPTADNYKMGINPYSTLNRPINQNTTYVNRPSSYQLRGQIYGESGIGSIGGYINRMTSGMGVGSVTINDDRRPITGNYIDRLMGEY